MLWLADRIDDVAAARPAFQVLFYLIAAELIAKITFNFLGQGRSPEFVHRFFAEICPEPARIRLATAFEELPSRRALTLPEVVSLLYWVRCDVAHMGDYYAFQLKMRDTAPDECRELIHCRDKAFATDLEVIELKQMVLQGAVRAAIGFLAEDARDSHVSATP